ncbi:MAG: hypothetical protein NVSMB18_26600 [Acetobacteraceae bacterium]
MQRSLPEVVNDVAGELSLLLGTAAALQEQVGSLAPGRDGIVALQSLDALTQGLACLSEFLSVLAGELPADVRPDLASALETVCLSAMAQRLSRSTPHGVAEPEGELELFGLD